MIDKLHDEIVKIQDLPDVKQQMEARGNFLRTAIQPSPRLTLGVTTTAVEVTDADGRTERLQTDKKKLDERAGNGLVKFKRRSYWEGAALVTEILYQPPYWVHALIWGPATLILSLGLLRPLKAGLMVLQYKHRAEEGRLIEK